MPIGLRQTPDRGQQKTYRVIRHLVRQHVRSIRDHNTAARGCSDIDALALPGDRSSKQRLEAAGFVARLLTLNRRLD